MISVFFAFFCGIRFARLTLAIYTNYKVRKPLQNCAFQSSFFVVTFFHTIFWFWWHFVTSFLGVWTFYPVFADILVTFLWHSCDILVTFLWYSCDILVTFSWNSRDILVMPCGIIVMSYLTMLLTFVLYFKLFFNSLLPF